MGQFAPAEHRLNQGWFKSVQANYDGFSAQGTAYEVIFARSDSGIDGRGFRERRNSLRIKATALFQKINNNPITLAIPEVTVITWSGPA
jgi:hypothetical protein